jgi:hypothetical protein
MTQDAVSFDDERPYTTGLPEVYVGTKNPGISNLRLDSSRFHLPADTSRFDMEKNFALLGCINWSFDMLQIVVCSDL